MARAIELAQDGLFTTTPNPRVGCVIVRDGAIVGEGSHKRAGEPHAEVLALADARAHVGADGLVGTTAYVTLEPCNHFGRTPPCVTALLEARVARVIAAMEDPNPQVAGAGLAALRHAGIEVRCGLLRREAEALNPGFIARMTRGTPWVRLTSGGQPRWPHRARQRRKPMDHGRGGACRWPCLARTRLRGTDRHRHCARR